MQIGRLEFFDPYLLEKEFRLTCELLHLYQQFTILCCGGRRNYGSNAVVSARFDLWWPIDSLTYLPEHRLVITKRRNIEWLFGQMQPTPAYPMA